MQINTIHLKLVAYKRASLMLFKSKIKLNGGSFFIKRCSRPETVCDKYAECDEQGSNLTFLHYMLVIVCKQNKIK